MQEYIPIYFDYFFLFFILRKFIHRLNAMSMPTRYIERIQLLNNLIVEKRTGTPKELAKKLKISESNLFKYLRAMRMIGAPVCFDKKIKSYKYLEKGTLTIYFEKF
jgi:predicted DNA-binding transcriptional regulator YafY